MKLLFLTAYPDIHGPLPKLAPILAEGLESCGLSVEIEHWSRHRENESLFEKVRGRAGDLRRVRRHLKQRPADATLVTTTHNWPALVRDIPLILVTRHLCPVIVLHFHGSMCDLLGKPGRRVFTLASVWLVRHCDAILLLSQQEVDEWRPWSGSTRLELVRNPFVPATKDASHGTTGGGPGDGEKGQAVPTVLFVGRLEASKGVFDLIQAFASVVRVHPSRLVLVGDGDVRRVRREAAAAGIANAIETTGYLSGEAVFHAYEAAEVFVLPSYREGFPTVILEAMSFGLPVVTTRIRGAADFLVEERNALFVEAGRPDALATALLRLLGDPEMRRAMGGRNVAAVTAFAPKEVVPSYAAILEDLAASRNGHS